MKRFFLMVVMALGLLAARGQYDITRITGTGLIEF